MNSAKHASVTRVIMHIIVRNGVACSAHVFAKFKFANNVLIYVHQNNRLYGNQAPHSTLAHKYSLCILDLLPY